MDVYGGAHAAVLMYSVSDERSFAALEGYAQETAYILFFVRDDVLAASQE